MNPQSTQSPIDPHIQLLKTPLYHPDLYTATVPVAFIPVNKAAPFIRTGSGRDIPLIAPSVDDYIYQDHEQQEQQQQYVQQSQQQYAQPQQQYQPQFDQFNLNNRSTASSGLLPSFHAQPTQPLSPLDEIQAHEKTLWQLLQSASGLALVVVDAVGGALASAFGISSNRYERQLYEAEEYEEEQGREKVMKRANSSFLREVQNENEWKMNSQC